MLSKFTKIIIISLLALIAGSSCLYLFADLTSKKGTYFPHLIHTGDPKEIKGGDACKDCHANAASATDMTKPLRPTDKTICKNCHEAEDQKPVKVVFKPQSANVIEFNHKLHVKDNETPCLDCHGKTITNDPLPHRGGLPQHKNCSSCHEEWLPGGDGNQNVHKEHCSKCHKSKIMPRDHYDNWAETHRIQAGGMFEKSCAKCHAELKGCAMCHAGGLFRPESHDLSWERTHKFNVRNQVQNCQSCHSDGSCQECHRTHGVSGSKGYRQRYDAGVHPPGWLADVPNTGDHHGVTARLKLDTCKACHIAQDCKSCHFRKYPYGR